MDLSDLLMPSNNVKNTFTKVQGQIHEFYLSGPILDPEEYIEWFDTIRSAGPNDDVNIRINSGGGDLYTAIQFKRVMRETEARVNVSVEGACMSAATIIFLAGDTVDITEHSAFMFHNYSGGAIGKGNEMHAQMQFEREWSAKLLRQVYAGFLSDDEITSILDGRDIWMSAEEAATRAQALMEARTEAENQLELEEE